MASREGCSRIVDITEGMATMLSEPDFHCPGAIKCVEKSDMDQAHLRIFHAEFLSVNKPAVPSMRRYVSSVLLLSAVPLSLLSPSMQVDASTITEWIIPTDNSAPREIYLDDNLLYFTEYSTNKIGCLNVSSGLFKEWTIPTADSDPQGIYVSGGLLYFTEYLGNNKRT